MRPEVATVVGPIAAIIYMAMMTVMMLPRFGRRGREQAQDSGAYNRKVFQSIHGIDSGLPYWTVARVFTFKISRAEIWALHEA